MASLPRWAQFFLIFVHRDLQPTGALKRKRGKGVCSVHAGCVRELNGSDVDFQALSLHLVWRLLLVYSVTCLVRESPQPSFYTSQRPPSAHFQRRPSGLSPCRPGFLPIISFRWIARLRASGIIEFYLLVNCFCVFRYRYSSPFFPPSLSLFTEGSQWQLCFLVPPCEPPPYSLLPK